MTQERIRQLNRKAITYVNTLQNSAKRMERYFDGTEEESIYPVEESNEVNAFWNKFLTTMNGMFIVYEDILNELPTEIAQPRILEMAERRNVAVKTIDGMLLIRVPHPPKKRSQYQRVNRVSLITLISQELPNLEFYVKKKVWIVNIYTEETMHRGRLLDFDNYDCKSLIDEACRPYPGSDSPITTKIAMETVITDQMLPMTYLLVSPQDFPEQQVLPLFLKAFGT